MNRQVPELLQRLTPRLNLPEAPVKLRLTPRGPEIWCPQRRKWLVLTPEEWVRQNFTQFMQTSLQVPGSMIANEMAVELNGTSRRCDTVVYSPSLRPLAIVEYKAPSVAVTPKVFDQIVRYNMVLHVAFLIVSNGMRHFCARVDYVNSRCTFMNALPAYADMLAAAGE